MSLFSKFDTFDPVSGDVPELPFSNLPDIARRARFLLRGRTISQISSAAIRINRELDSYFSDLKYVAVEELRTALLQGDDNEIETYFERVASNEEDRRWEFRDDMEEVLEISTADNCSEVDALKTIIENRDSCFFLPKDAPEPEIEHWSEGKTHELFAVLSLWLLADSIRRIEIGARSGLSMAGEYAVKAMDAVCYAEHVHEVDWLEQFHKKQLLEASSSQGARISGMEEKIRTDLMAEQIAHERAKQTTRSKQMNAARHQATKNAKELVCKAWEKALTDFPSAEKAGNHYADWLKEQSIGYKLKGTQVFYQPRAVTLWIRQRAKEKGIKFR